MTRIGIHIGHIHPIRMRCIASQIESYGPFDIWVSDNNWQWYANQMCKDLGLAHIPASLDADTLTGKVQISDWLRFWFASKTPDMLWCDTDLEVLDPMRGLGNHGTPYHGHSRNEAYDYYYFAVNGGCDWYRRGLDFMLAHADYRCPALNYVHNPENQRYILPIRQETFRHWAFDKENTEQHWQKETTNIR